MKGRGSSGQPANRFTGIEWEPDPEYLEWLRTVPEDGGLTTETLEDHSKSILSKNSSPDIDFDYSLNPYRGCEHGCAYCYARPSHEFLGFSAGLDFESKIVVKKNAASLLRDELSKKSWGVHRLVMSGVTDPYQPLEKELEITRGCLEVLADFRQPVELITKNYLITRDIDLLERLSRYRACSARISITSLDSELSRILEPRASAPERRLKAVRLLSDAGVPVGVNVSPVIPGLNDHELPAIIAAAAEAGAQWVHYIPLRLPGAVAPIFLSWLEQYKPHSRDKVVRLVKELRGGKLNETAFHSRFQGKGEVASRLRQLFDLGRKKVKLPSAGPELCSRHFQVPGPKQLGLFD
jgi:DNA repair photolyase